MDFEDESELNYYKELEKRLKNLERQFSDFNNEVFLLDKKDLESITDTLKKLNEIKLFFAKSNKNDNNPIDDQYEESGKHDFVKNMLEEFKENSLLFLNTEKLKYKEENQILKEELENYKLQVEALNIQLQKKQIIETQNLNNNNNFNGNNSIIRDNSSMKSNNNIIYNKNNFENIQNNKLRLSSNKKSFDNTSLFGSPNFNYNDLEYMNNYNNRNSNLPNFGENNFENYIEINENFDKNESKNNFWEKFELKEQENKKNGLIDSSVNRYNNPTFGNISSDNKQNGIANIMINKGGIYDKKNTFKNSLPLINNENIGKNKNFENKISTNMRKYSPYILNKKNS